MTQTRDSFLGLQIQGDIHRRSRREQRPVEQFRPLVRAMLDDPTVVEFGWEQYTPYFNDGDPCIFRASSAWVRLEGDNPTDEQEIRDHRRLGRRESSWRDGQPHRGAYTGPDEDRHDRCHAFSDAIEDGAFDDVLLELFGDHAEVTVRRNGIQVSFYHHD